MLVCLSLSLSIYLFLSVHGRLHEFVQRGENILEGREFEKYGTGTNEGADYTNRTAKSVNILICFTFLRSF